MEKAKGLTVGDLEPRFGDLPPAPGPGRTTGTGRDDDATAGAERTEDVADAERAGPVDPDALDPTDPDVAGLIREWTSIARPPENAVPGSNWRYDSVGRVVGSGPGMHSIDSRTHDSVQYATGTPEATAWSFRKKLDSIDHCTLEEYVVARLENESISHCVGRYGALKDLKGERLDRAMAFVTGAGFKYDNPVPGTPAETPEANGTIERQEPGPNQYLKKGQVLKLVVHTPYVAGKVSLPSFIGEPLGKAKKWLDKNKLTMQRPKAGSPAPSKNKSGMIEAQEPVAGTVMKAGGKVTFAVHSNYIDVRTVPRVVKVSAKKAMELIETAGLKANPKSGGKPPSREKAGTVKRQSPEPGVSIPAGSDVAIYIYGPYVDTAKVPDVRKLTYEEARRRLKAAGLSIGKRDAGRPGKRDLAKTAKKQDPPPKTEISKGKTVLVWFYEEYEPTRQEQVAAKDCSQYPGSQAYWDDAERKPKCGCPEGYTWATGQTHCERRLPPDKLCARNHPGSVPTGRDANGVVICGCPQGFVWETPEHKRCVRQQSPNELCARDYPGSIARGRASDGSINCECPQGYVWDSPQHRKCVPQLTPGEVCSRDYPGSVPTGRAADGSINCACPQGYTWVDDPRRCVKKVSVNRDIEESGGGGGGGTSCSCEVDTSLMIRSDGFCTTFVESRDPQGRLDPHGINKVIHIVHDDQFSRGWRVPNGWLKGRYNTCEVLLNDSQAGCAVYCR